MIVDLSVITEGNNSNPRLWYLVSHLLFVSSFINLTVKVQINMDANFNFN